MTLQDLRCLLEGAIKHADNPAIQRLPEEARTVEGLVRAYLPRHISIKGFVYPIDTTMLLDLADEKWPTWATEWRAKSLDLSDPGTTHAVVVALALFLGLDPGEASTEVRWLPMNKVDGSHYGWWVGAFEASFDFIVDVAEFHDEIEAPEVAAEPDARKALALAVKRVLGAA